MSGKDAFVSMTGLILAAELIVLLVIPVIWQ